MHAELLLHTAVFNQSNPLGAVTFSARVRICIKCFSIDSCLDHVAPERFPCLGSRAVSFYPSVSLPEAGSDRTLSVSVSAICYKLCSDDNQIDQ